MMNCSACGHENPDHAKFCLDCGAGFAMACSHCGTDLPGGAKFCLECGTAVGATAPDLPTERSPRDYTPKHLADKILQSKSALEGERKQVTVMFADVKGSMELAEQLDPEVWHRILDRFFAILAEGVHRFEGTVNQYTGDGIMALFGAPIAHEDHAHRACFSALHLRDEIRRYANDVRSEYGVIFGARIGLNSGEVVVGKIGDDLRMDYTAQGHTVGLAQRMEALADSGRICVSEQCAKLVQGYFELTDMGPVTVKGASEPVGLFELEDVGAFRTRLDRSRARGLSGFVGRSDEMAALESALEQALAGQGRIAGVVADAGIGKSRLCYEFVERCRARGVTVYEAHCPAHGKTIPMLPALELMRGYFGVSESDSAQITREKIAGRLLLLDKDFDEVLPLVWDFMRVPDSERTVEELDADTRQQKLFTFVRQLVHARSKREPGVLFIDDLHWVDPASDEIIAQLADALRGTRTLLLVNFRPEYRADWMQRPNYQQLPLAPLPRDALRQLIADLLGPDPSVSLLPEVIESQTAGNPFFTEEVVQSLIESKQLEGSAGSYRLTVEAARIELPASVHSVLAARIDRLEEREKRVLQAASVIGKIFPQPLLHEIADLDDAELADSLRALCEAEFIFERSLYPVVEFAFKHPLTHEVAYLTQLAERRRAVHAVVAKRLEAIGESAAMLAYHWDAADVPEPAIRWHKQAAAEGGRIDSDEVLHRWQRIAEFLARLPESPDTLAEKAAACAQLLLIESRRGVTRERARSLYDSACDFGTRSGDSAPLTKANISFGLHLLYSGQPGSQLLIHQAVDEAEEIGDRELMVFALMINHLVGLFSDPLASTFAANVKRVIELCDGDLDVGFAMLGYSAVLMSHAFSPHELALAGDLEAAIAAGVVATEDHGPRHRTARALSRVFAMQASSLAGDHRAALADGITAIAEVSEMGAVGIVDIAVRSYLSAAQVRAGAFDDARLTLGQALESTNSLDTGRHFEAECLTWLALAHLGLGNAERTKTLLDEATERAERQEMRLPLARIHIARGQLIAVTRPEALEEANAVLNAAHSLANELGCLILLPEIELVRAELFERRGELEAAREAKERAPQLFQQQGAKANAERLADQLEASV